MPLLDHFHPPVSKKRHWSELHGWWPGEFVHTLFDLLPPGYQAGPQLYLGSSFEVNVSVAEEDARPELPPDVGTSNATLPDVEPPFTVVADLIDVDEYEVRIYDEERERTLVAAIEIVSPSNKGRPESRTQFVTKAAALLREGVCVSMVDIVTARSSNLYIELLNFFGQNDPRLGHPPPALYAVTLRTRRRLRELPLVDAWYYPLTIGQPIAAIQLRSIIHAGNTTAAKVVLCSICRI